MQHPDTNRIRDIMKAIVEVRAKNYLPEIVHMLSASDPICWTPGCHAGELYIGMSRITDMSVSVKLENMIEYDYLFVANMFAAYLFPDLELAEVYNLQQWAHDHPELWGNHYGFYMFYRGEAFGQHENTFPPSIITDHWLAVADRIDALK